MTTAIGNTRPSSQARRDRDSDQAIDAVRFSISRDTSGAPRKSPTRNGASVATPVRIGVAAVHTLPQSTSERHAAGKSA